MRRAVSFRLLIDEHNVGYVAFSGCFNLQLPMLQTMQKPMQLPWKPQTNLLILTNTTLPPLPHNIKTNPNQPLSLPRIPQRQQQRGDLQFALLGNLHNRLRIKSRIIHYLH
jgi:hypothetical protein